MLYWYQKVEFILLKRAFYCTQKERLIVAQSICIAQKSSLNVLISTLTVPKSSLIVPKITHIVSKSTVVEAKSKD